MTYNGAAHLNNGPDLPVIFAFFFLTSLPFLLWFQSMTLASARNSTAEIWFFASHAQWLLLDWISYVIFRWVIAIKSAKASKYQSCLISHEFCSAWYTALLVNLQISDFSGWQEGELVPQIWISGRCSIRNTFRKYHIFSTSLLSHLFRPHKTTEIRIWHWRKYKKTTEPRNQIYTW